VTFPTTWAAMRGEFDAGRTWLTYREAMAVLKAEGYLVTSWDFRRVTKGPGLPRLASRYGHYRYEPEHMEAVRAFASREGLVNRKEATCA